MSCGSHGHEGVAGSGESGPSFARCCLWISFRRVSILISLGNDRPLTWVPSGLLIDLARPDGREFAGRQLASCGARSGQACGLQGRRPSLSAWGHVDEAAVVPLERHRHRRGRAVPVLGDDQVRLARPRRLPLVGIFAVQQDDDV